jgi:esterase/lipase superfamily enzyme/uncharacterized protein YjbI with pentapeptide repeats
MASETHLVLLSAGRSVWNTWRRDNRFVDPDLSRADLSHRDLRHFNLDQANLSGSILASSDLTNATLRNSDLSGTLLSGAVLVRANLVRARIHGADMSQCNLTSANLSECTLSDSRLDGSIISRTRFSRATMDASSLREVSGTGAIFDRAILYGVDFTDAALRRPSFKRSNIEATHFDKATLIEPQLWLTAFSNPDSLSEATVIDPSFEPTKTPSHSKGARPPGRIPDSTSRDVAVFDPSKIVFGYDPEEGQESRSGNVLTGASTTSYPVWFATDRLARRGDPADGFSAKRGDNVQYGVVHVHIPESHKIGSVGSSWWKELLTGVSDEPLGLKEIYPLTGRAFWEQIAILLKADRADAVIFIHGYNTSFKEAAIRAAQLGHDLQIRGLMAMYSWPSAGKFLAYKPDEASIEGSEVKICRFLVDFVRNSGASNVHIIAHSMGNRAVLRSMQRIVAAAEKEADITFGQFILAAPDVDYDLFKELAEAYVARTRRTTIYISDRDKALGFSGYMHKFPRAGYAPPVVVIPGVDTVHVRNVDMTMLGHGYVAQAREVLHDIHALLFDNKPPDKRMGLRPIILDNGAIYWAFRA